MVHDLTLALSFNPGFLITYCTSVKLLLNIFGSVVGCMSYLTRVLLFADVGVSYICTLGSFRCQKDGESSVPTYLVARITCICK